MRPLLILFHQFSKGFQGSLDHCGLDAVRDPNVAGTAEGIGGNEQKLMFLRAFREGFRVRLRGFDEQVEGAVRMDAVVAEGSQGIVQKVAVSLIDCQIRGLPETLGHDPLH